MTTYTPFVVIQENPRIVRGLAFDGDIVEWRQHETERNALGVPNIAEGNIIGIGQLERGVTNDVGFRFPDENVSIVKLHDFKITDIYMEFQVKGPYPDMSSVETCGHRFFHGTTEDGSKITIPDAARDLSDPSWDLMALKEQLESPEWKHWRATPLAHFISQNILHPETPGMEEAKAKLNGIFYGHQKDGKGLFSHASFMDITSLKVTHEGPGIRAQLVLPVRKDPPHLNPMGYAAIMRPYIAMDGKPVFIDRDVSGPVRSVIPARSRIQRPAFGP
ncbi:MAG TPA: hypothetical protein VHB73_04955 [Alphaproteobacteria bacterium]|nr:hypothetical protein [Alphaproteobacteria bacterium]